MLFTKARIYGVTDGYVRRGESFGKHLHLFRGVVLLIAEVTLHAVVLNHLHVLQNQRTAVLLGVHLVVVATLSQGVVGGANSVCLDPLLAQHGLSGISNLVKLAVVDVVKRHQLGSLVVFVIVCKVSKCSMTTISTAIGNHRQQ